MGRDEARRKATAWTKVQRQGHSSHREGEVEPCRLDMDVDTNVVPEQWEDYEGSEYGAPPPRTRGDVRR